MDTLSKSEIRGMYFFMVIIELASCITFINGTLLTKIAHKGIKSPINEGDIR